MPKITWNTDADAKLLSAILQVHGISINNGGVAEVMGDGVTASAVANRISKIKARAKGAGGGGGIVSGVTGAKVVKKSGMPRGHKASVIGTAKKGGKAATGGQEGEDEEGEDQRDYESEGAAEKALKTADEKAEDRGLQTQRRKRQEERRADKDMEMGYQPGADVDDAGDYDDLYA